MKRLLFTLIALASAAASLAAERPRQLDKAKVLPLALDDAFEFRKTKMLFNDRATEQPSIDPMIIFERQRINHGAISNYDREQRFGHYFTFFWRTKRTADVIVRLEYRQQNLGAYVQAKELFYKEVKGSVKSEFSVIGDDYKQEGKITGWRALLIENGKIVALNQSYLWN